MHTYSMCVYTIHTTMYVYIIVHNIWYNMYTHTYNVCIIVYSMDRYWI